MRFEVWKSSYSLTENTILGTFDTADEAECFKNKMFRIGEDRVIFWIAKFDENSPYKLPDIEVLEKEER